MSHKGLSSAPLLRSLHPGGANAPGKASRHGAWCGCTERPRPMMRPLALEKTEPWTVSGSIMFAGDSLLPSLPEGTRVPLGASCCLCVKSSWAGLSRRWSRQTFPYYPKVTRCRPMAKTQTQESGFEQVTPGLRSLLGFNPSSTQHRSTLHSCLQDH